MISYKSFRTLFHRKASIRIYFCYWKWNGAAFDKRRKFDGYIYQVLLVLLTSGLLNAEYRSTRSQYFIEKPQNQTLNEGETTMLQCQVGNLQGVVQWTRNGFAMGYSDFEVKQTCQRCELDVSKDDGIYNLIVQNIRLGEDQYYECQVSPGKSSINSLPLRAPVHLTIQVPPKSVMLRPPSPVMAGNLVELACTAEDSNPKTEILWYRDNQQIKEGEVSEKVLSGSRNGTYVTVSKITLPKRAIPGDDGTNIICKAEHPALISSEIYPHLEDSGTLSILYPPSMPQILGDISPYRRKGDKVSLSCVASGGNPFPELTWVRNGLPLRDSGLFTSSSKALFSKGNNVLQEKNKVRKFTPQILIDKLTKEIRSVLEFPLIAEDHGAIYKCRSFAEATMSVPQDSALTITFNITFPPDTVTISGDPSVPVDKTSVYRCEAKNANPAPQIQWVVNDDVINVDNDLTSTSETSFGDNLLHRSSTQSRHSSSSASVQVTTQIHPPPSLSMSSNYGSGSIQSLETGYRVTSDLRLKAEQDEDKLSLTCIATSHGHDGEIMTKEANVNIMVLKPPSAPVITGLPENQALREGQTVLLTCSATDGSPKPKLSWFKVNGDGSDETALASDISNSQSISTDKNTGTELPNSKLETPLSNVQSKATIKIIASREDNNRLYRCDSSNEANKNDPASSHVRLNVFFPPKTLEITVERPESRISEGQYDRTTEYLGDKLKQLTQSPRNVNGIEAPQRTSPASRNEKIKLVLSGELVRLKCVAGISKPRPLFRWTSGNTFEDQHHLKDNRTEIYDEIPHGGMDANLDYLQQGERMVSIVEFVAQPVHNGRVYRCYAQNPTTAHQDGEAQLELNATVTIVVLFKPQFTNKSVIGSGNGVFTVIEGDTRNISLEAYGNPPQIHYAWSYPSTVTDACKDERNIKNTKYHGKGSPCRIKASSSVLTVRNAKRTDSGDYSVQASNAHGDFNTLATVHLNVLFPPKITSISEAVTVDEGKPAVFNCTVDANPNDDDLVSWDLPDRDSAKSPELDYFDVITRRGQGVFPSHKPPKKPNWRKRLISDKLDQQTTRLTIVKVKREDAGRVVCRAGNGVGGETTNSMKTTYLKVNHPPWIERTEEQRRLDILSKDTSRNVDRNSPPYVKVAAQLGHQLSIECRATGVPDVSVAWQKHIKPSKLNHKVIENFDDDSFDQEDEIYSRTESKETDSVKIKKRKYNLKNKKRNKEKKDYPISDYRQIYVIDKNKGESIGKTERCGDYEKHVMRRDTFCSELNLDNVRTEHYSTLFRCNATNTYGTDEIFYKIVRPGSPGTPQELSAENITDTSIQIAWRPGFNGGASQKYFVQVKETKSGHEKYKLKYTKEITKPVTVISGLQPNMMYTFRVKARNRHGTSDFSEEIEEKTRPMESLESKSNASVGEVVVLAIGVCMVVIIAVTIVIYLTCFKNGPRFGLTGPGAVGPRSVNTTTGKDHKRKQKLKFGDDFKKRDRSNSDGGFNGQTGIQRYTTSKYTNAIHAGLCTLTPTYDRPPHSSTTSSQPDYRELARSLSVPGRDYLGDDDGENRGLISIDGSGYGRNIVRNGKNSYKENDQGPCSLHGTLRRGTNVLWGSSGACNNPDLTLEDDVFDEKPSPLPGLMSAITCKGNAGTNSRSIFVNPPDPNHHSRFGYFSKGDPLDSSSSSRSRSVIIPTPNLPISVGALPAPSRFSTSTRVSSSKFSGNGIGLNDSGLGSTCTTVAFAEKEHNLGRLRFPSSSGTGCTLVTGGVEDCSKTSQKQFPLSSTMKPQTRTYYDHQYGGNDSSGDVRKRTRSTGSFLSRHRSSGSIDGIDGVREVCRYMDRNGQHFVECDQDLSIDTPTPPPPPPPPAHSISNILLEGDCTLPRKLDSRRTNLSQYTFGKVKRADITANPSFINNKSNCQRQFLSSNGRLPNTLTASTFRPTDSSGSSSGVGGTGAGVNAKKLFHGIMKIKDSTKGYNQGQHFPLRRAGSPPNTLPPPPPPPLGVSHVGFGQSYAGQQQLGTSSFKLPVGESEKQFPDNSRRFDSNPSLLV